MSQQDGLYKEILDNLQDGVYFTDRNRRISYWNKGAEKITGYRTSQVVGLHCFDNLLMHVDDAGTRLCFGQCPLAKTIQDGQAREADVYLHHADGHRVPVHLRVTPLRDEAGEIIGGIETFADNSTALRTRRKMDKLQTEALHDALTGIGNRRYLEAKLYAALTGCKGQGLVSGLIFLDIDQFKGINDTFGHPAGDRALKMVAETLRRNVRVSDHIGRWGGDEFMVILECTERDNLLAIAEKLRLLVELCFLAVEDQTLQLTISAGATFTRPGDTPKSLLERADGLLYHSKQNGRNQVTVEE